MVVVVDETLVGSVDVIKGLKPGGRIIINTARKPNLVAELFKGFDGEVYAVDAADISLRTIGKNLPNSPLLSVVARLAGVIGEEEFFVAVESALAEKFGARPEVVKGNMDAVREAWNGAVHVNGN
jgi:pyruvate ferredoxin oxidoreductase gamma subunit